MCFFGDLMTTNLPRDGISSAKVFTRFGPGNQQLLGAYNEIAKFEEAAGAGG